MLVRLAVIALILAFVIGRLNGDHLRRMRSVSPYGVTRQWDRFDEAVAEVIDARVYSGIHFRTADEDGARLGRQVAHFAFTHALKPCKGKGKCS